MAMWIDNVEYFSIEEYAAALIKLDTKDGFVVVNAYLCDEDRIKRTNPIGGFIFEKSAGYDALCKRIKDFNDYILG